MYATALKFKTAAKYISQPVTLGHEVKELFECFLDHVRPAIAPKDEDPAVAPLFLRVRSDGKVERDCNLGSHIARFARQYGLNLTPTTIRQIVDTNVVAEHRRGNVTDEQLQAIFTVSGHSEATSRKFYQK